MIYRGEATLCHLQVFSSEKLSGIHYGIQVTNTNLWNNSVNPSNPSLTGKVALDG